MMFELLLDVMDRLVNLRDTDAERAIALLPMLSDTAQVRPKAFSNIRIQDRNTLLGAENAMNV